MPIPKRKTPLSGASRQLRAALDLRPPTASRGFALRDASSEALRSLVRNPSVIADMVVQALLGDSPVTPAITRTDHARLAATLGERLEDAEWSDARPRREGVGTLGLPDALPEAPPIAPTEEKLGWFEVTVVDAWGQPVGGIDVEVTHAGNRKKLRTPASGRVRVEQVAESFGSARIVDVPAVRELLRPRWAKKPPTSPPDVDNPQVLPLADELDAVGLENEKPRTIILVRPLTRVRLIGMHFDTNKSFMRPTAVPGIRRVLADFERSPRGNALVVGHTDTVAEEHYNLDLSLERAEAVKAYLKRDVPAWLAWFDDGKPPKKKWAAREIAQMISALPCEQSVEGFQTWSNEARGTSLVVDGKAGPATRKELVTAYMELGGPSLHASIGIAVHGCGEYFPQEETGDEVENEENRRVEIFCFDDVIHPPVPGKKAKKGEPEYDAWKNQVTKDVDVLDAPPLIITVGAEKESEPRLLITDPDGEIVRAFGEEEGVRHEGSLVFHLDTKQMPASTQLVVERWGVEFPHGVPFDPNRLVLALRKNDNAAVTAIVYGTAPSSSGGGGQILGVTPVSTPTTVVNDTLRIEIDTKGDEKNLDLKNKFLQGLKITLDGLTSKPSSPASPANVAVQFDLSLATKVKMRLRIVIPDVPSAPGATTSPILDIDQEIKFAKDLDTNEFILVTTNLHPRLTGLKPSGSSGATIWTLRLDVSFLDVTQRTTRENRVAELDPNDETQIVHVNRYKELPHHIDDAGVAVTRVLLDPRVPHLEPTTWTVCSALALHLTVPKVNVFLYFQNENGQDPDPDQYSFHNERRMLLQSGDRFGLPPGVFTSSNPQFPFIEYPDCGWAKQLARSDSHVVMVMPNVVFKGGASFGDLMGTRVSAAVKRLRKMILMGFWANDPDREAIPPKLGKVIVGGWSSGMNTVFQWFAADPEKLVDAFFCFDAVGAKAIKPDEPKPPNAAPKPFPGGAAWETWLTERGDNSRHVAFISGHYSEEGAGLTGAYLAKKALDDRILLNEPSKAGSPKIYDPEYWYTHVDYKRAHLDETFKVLPVTATDQSYFVSEKGKTYVDHTLTIRHGSDPKGDVALKVSQEEAANFMKHSLGTFAAAPTKKQYDAAFFALLHTGNAEEDERAGKIRHAWSVIGGKGVGTATFVGYLQQCLTAIKPFL
jgi:outer membrane protein OmpA-like peptidoglycan-associated protein